MFWHSVYTTKVRCSLLQILQKISMILILHSVCSVQMDSFMILFSPWWRKLACPRSFFGQFFYHAWPNHNIGPNQFDIWSNLNDIWTKQIVISDPIRLISSPITQCYLLSFLTQSQWHLMEQKWYLTQSNWYRTQSSRTFNTWIFLPFSTVGFSITLWFPTWPPHIYSYIQWDTGSSLWTSPGYESCDLHVHISSRTLSFL